MKFHIRMFTAVALCVALTMSSANGGDGKIDPATGDTDFSVHFTFPPTQQQIDEIIHNIDAAARVALDGLARDDVDIRNAAPVDAQKFDIGDTAA